MRRGGAAPVPMRTRVLIRVGGICFVPMKRAIFLGLVAVAGLALGASPSRAAAVEPCHPSEAVEAPCLKTPPCLPPEAPCQS